MRVKFGVLEQTQGLHLHAKFHVNQFIVSASGDHKPQFWANFDILGAPVPTPFYQWGPNVVCYSKPALHAYVPNFVSIGLFCHPLLVKNPNFCHFWTSAFSGVTIWQQSDKVGHGCTTTNLPLSNRIKIVFVLQRLYGEIWRTISDILKHNGQTVKKLNVFGHSGGRWNPSPTKLGMVIEDLEHVLAPLKRLEIWHVVS